MFEKIVDAFIRAFTESTVTKFTVIVLVFAPMSYLLVTKSEVPDGLYGMAGLILGYFFTVTVNKRIAERRDK